jgi:hypothetical protein
MVDSTFAAAVKLALCVLESVHAANISAPTTMNKETVLVGPPCCRTRRTSASV